MSRIERRTIGKRVTSRKGMLITVIVVVTLIAVAIVSLFVLPDMIRKGRSSNALDAGIDYCKNGDLESAESSFELATSLNPDDVASYYDLALVYMAGEGDYVSALKNLKQATLLEPDFARAYHNIGVIQYFYCHDRALALKNLIKAAELDPDYAPTRVALGMTYESLGEYAKSREEYYEYLNLDADGPWSDWVQQHIKVIEDQPDVDGLGERLVELMNVEKPYYEILCTGDISLDRTSGQSDSSYSPLAIVAPELAKSTVTVGNLVSPITEKGTSGDGKLKGDPDYSFILTEAGYDVVAIANDHIMDFGNDGLADTLRNLGDAEIKTAGAGPDIASALKPAVIELEDYTIHILSFNAVGPSGSGAGVAPADLTTMRRALAASSSADIVVVYLYWGLEKAPYPTKEQKEQAHLLIDAGADIIVGTHPDVTQPIERYNGGIVAYSIGKFLMGDIYGSRHYSSILAVEVSPEFGILGFRLIPIYIEGTRSGIGEKVESIELVDYTLIDGKGKPVAFTSDYNG
ncbi:MAG: tetratricopeptide repeat protein [bacterium]|nr:tetratricopeptide repeat protein [bacterium]